MNFVALVGLMNRLGGIDGWMDSMDGWMDDFFISIRYHLDWSKKGKDFKRYYDTRTLILVKYSSIRPSH